MPINTKSENARPEYPSQKLTCRPRIPSSFVRRSRISAVSSEAISTTENDADPISLRPSIGLSRCEMIDGSSSAPWMTVPGTPEMPACEVMYSESTG